MKFINLWTRSIIIIICLITVVACSTTTIHVNTLYLDDDETEKIKAALNNQGFKVELNELSYPDSIYSTSMLYSPFIKDPKAIKTLESTLQSLGYDISSINGLVVSNHWYTKNTIGLFVVPDGVIPNSGKNIEDIALKYQSDECNNDVELSLYTNGKFAYTALNKAKISGTWSITQYPYILLKNDDPYLYFYYEITRSRKIDRISEIDIIKLKPLSSTPIIPKCNMIHGLRL